MDKHLRKEVKNPRQDANVISILTFWWIFKLFVVGYNKELEESDLYSPLREDRSNHLGQRIVKAWGKELKRYKEKGDGHKPRLLVALRNCFGKRIIHVGLVLVLLEFGLRIFQPILLGKLLHYLSGDKQQWKSEIYYYAAAFCFLPFIECFLSYACFQSLMHVGMKIRVACSTLIYRKILKLSNSVLETETSAGEMVNFLSNDVNRLDYSVFDIHYIWIAPLQTLVITYFLFIEIGWAAIIGMLTFLMFIPLQLFFGSRVSRLTLSSAQRTDNRLRLMNQIIAGIEIIKMYVWEIPYSLLVEKAREKEVNVIKKNLIIEQFGLSFDIYVPRLATFITILTYVITGNNIDAEKVFLVTSFYNILRSSMCIGFSLCINELAEGLVSIKRIERFLMQSEIEQPVEKIHQVASQSIPVYLKNVTAKWNSVADDTLHNVDLTVKSGDLVAIIGQIGSGKSSLLQAVLGELPLLKGTLETYGKLSYGNQSPWIFASSVRQNILFGQPMNQARYDEVIRVCQLQPDIDSFAHGDSTIVGERGMNLSGGQRARINMARAIYADAAIYLLDDPLSAVDAHVGSRIVEECICGFLKNKTRILVTHQLQYLKYADLIVVMNAGGIKVKGNFGELQSRNLDFMEIFKETEKNKVEEESERRKVARKSLLESKEQEKDVSQLDPVEVAEIRTKGKISFKVFLSYWKASKNMYLVFLAMCILCVSQTVASGSDYLLAFWVNIEATSWIRDENGTMLFEWNDPFPRDGIIYLYSSVTISVVCLCVVQTFIFYGVCMRSSKNLHLEMFRSIVRSTMYFYNTNPAGRILNRFSKDIAIIDKRLPYTAFDVIVNGLIFLGVVTIVGVVSPWLLIPTFVVIVLFYCLRVIYISTSRDIKRMEGITRSPVFDHVGATLQGLTTIRAFKAEEKLTLEFDNHQDLHTSSYFMFMSTSRTFGLYIEFFCLLYVATITAVFLVFDDLAVAGDIGLVITQVIAVTAALQWGLRQTAELENQITSVERVLEYSRLEEEPFLDSKPEKKPPKDWPKRGHIEFRNVKLRYGPKSAYVLKGISFVAMPKEKIGVVGRTGAGKTSLISALFRLAFMEGEVVIDDIATSSVALHDFRSKISIIPQEPVLFGGSLRRNLDPFDEYPDNLLWDALEQVELKETILDTVRGLNTRVAEEGSNFSVGQRQLLCLVRALIRSNKVMVLDEATANVDPRTDLLIQTTVRKKFMDCTVFTVAHRLNTIMDSDKILVMDQGRIAEFDHPYVLLQKKGYFYGMVENTGPSMAVGLTEIAKKSFYKNDVTPS